MTVDEIARRLRAWGKGRPLPKGATRHFPIVEPAHILIVAFVKMGGESAPWGIAYGRPGRKPEILTVPEPRDRDLVADMVARFAPALLKHFWHPDVEEKSPEDPREAFPLRQLWLPNPTHLEMLHFLDYAYTFTKWGDSERANLLRAFGRLAGFLFREARRPGQVTVMVATDALRDAYTFPAEDVRQAHLGYLLAWLQTRGGRDARLRAAQEEELLAVATSLDPALERDSLADLLEQWSDARSDADDRRAEREARRLGEVLKKELLRRFDLVERTIQWLEEDRRPENKGVARLAQASRQELWYQYLRVERGRNADDDGPAFVASPETDRYPAAAASRYFVHEASEDLRISALIHDDEELQEEAIAEGVALRGVIVDARDDDPGRRLEPVWTIEADDVAPLRIREGSWLCVAGLPERTVMVRRIEPTGPGKLLVEVEVINLKTKPRDGRTGVLQADDPRLRGLEVTLVPASSEGISRRKSQKIWDRATPGAWLTHSRPGGPKADLPPEVAEDLDEISGTSPA